MIRNEMYFGGQSMTTFSAFIAESNFLDAPARNVDSIAVLGRNGNVHIDRNKYENFNMRVRLYITEHARENFQALRNYLNEAHGYRRYQETFSPNEYRMACFMDAFVVDVSDSKNGVVTLAFDCMPQRFLTAGEQPITVTTSATLLNPTKCEARPLIKAYGQGTAVINGVTVTVGGSDPVTVIDCEMMTCSQSDVTFSGYDYPVLGAGSNVITVSGLTKVEITPRWWRL